MVFMSLEIVLPVRFGLVVPEGYIKHRRNILGMQNIETGFIVPVFVLNLTVIQNGIWGGGIVIDDLGRGQQIRVVSS